MSDPQPKTVTIDDGSDDTDTPPTTREALAAVRRMVLALRGDLHLAQGLLQFAGAAAGSPTVWRDMVRRHLAELEAEEVEAAREEEAGDRIAEEHNRIAEQHGLISIWSVNGADDLAAPHPYEGAKIVVHATISGIAPGGTGRRVWGGDGGRFEAPVYGPRWLDLWLAGDVAIQASGDLHHRFIESFDADPEHPTELRMDVGS